MQRKIQRQTYKLFDSEGLYLYVPASGKKAWRFKYRFNNKEGLITVDKVTNQRNLGSSIRNIEQSR
ncbi:MAG: hypothetical protein ACI9J2_001810 [Saprospiraceae bacterium]|jgi:hypothetical protein